MLGALLLIAIFIIMLFIGQKFKITGEIFSSQAMIKMFLNSLKRFPVSTLLFSVLFGLCFTYQNIRHDIWYVYFIFTPVAAIIGIIITLISENYFKLTIKSHLISVFTVLIWGAYCLSLPKRMNDITTAKNIELWMLIVTISCMMFFIPFWRKNKDRIFLNFIYKMFSGLAFSYFVSFIIFLGLSLALYAVDKLVWNIGSTHRLSANLSIICFVLFAPIYFMSNIPKKEDNYGNKDSYIMKVGNKLSLYVLTPLLAIYTVILYIYLFKIIITWNLPKGWVSTFVSLLAFGGLWVMISLYSLSQKAENKIVNFIYRWFGLIVLPPLFLMSIGIFRRIGDYGITINRGYVLLLNLWFYAIYLYLFFTKGRSIKHIFVSPLIIALTASVSIWGVADITHKSLVKEANEILDQKVSFKEAGTIISNLKLEEKKRMKSIFKYLYKKFGRESVQTFFKDRVPDYSYDFLKKIDWGINYKNKIEKREWIAYNILQTKKRETVRNIRAYNSFIEIDYKYYDLTYNSHNKKALIFYSEEKDDIIKIIVDKKNTFLIPIRKTLMPYFKKKEREAIVIKGKNYKMIINDFRGYYYPGKDSIRITSIDGYLFYRAKK